MDEHLTPKQVANALQVSESSVKRWCDAGDIPTIRTTGGHRRIPISGLVQFLEESNRKIFDPKAIGLLARPLSDAEAAYASNAAKFENYLVEFHDALLAGDELASRRILMSWYAAQPSIAKLADRLIAESFHRIGIEWACDKIDVFQERRSCEICFKLIHELRRLVPEPGGDSPIAIGGAPEHDTYAIPTQLIELVMRESGWRATNLGPNLPFQSLLKAAQHHQPKVFWLSVSYIEDQETFLREYDAFASGLPAGTALVVGGRALDDSIRPKLQFAAHCDNLQQLSKLAGSLRNFRPQWRASDN